MKVFVTGGAGYIGSHCSAMLVEKGHEVTVFDNLTTGRRELVPDSAKFILGDITVPEQIISAIATAKPDIVMHFAAKCIIPESIERPIFYWEQNVLGTVNLLRAMEESDGGKLIFSSTVAVYGDPADIPITEKTPVAPISPYGTTKASAESAIVDSALTGKIQHIILRYFNVGGAGYGIRCEAENETRLIPLALKAAAGEIPELQIFGDDYPTRDGSCVRDFIHVLDIAEAHISAMDYLEKGNPSEIINLGSHEGFTVLEIASTTREITGVDFPIRRVGRREGDTPVVIASNDKARNILGWNPRRGLREIIASMTRVEG